ncbi:Arc family DNA-binding protein [Endozoicomonas sp. SESOKO4]|uniref:Arc family DNA-binding protein n=1 Tax=Endozoicomonas sp. SESOKO4 TaxID=2828745 RepID=UPI002148EBD0|nr:Arc family DNA-binding protein [Endozoicomonas sp. SESOKO4]
MSRSWPVYSLRVPEDVHAQISKAARRNKRSINSEYLYRIETSLAQASSLEQLLKEVRELNQRIEKMESKKPD